MLKGNKKNKISNPCRSLSRDNSFYYVLKSLRDKNSGGKMVQNPRCKLCSYKNIYMESNKINVRRNKKVQKTV